LTANLQLQRPCNPSVDLPEPKLRALARFEHRTFQVGPRSKIPSCRASRLRPLRPRAEHAALPLTPSVATTHQAQPFDRSRTGSRQAPLPPPSRQRQPLRRNQDAFLRRVRSPPRPARVRHAACAAHRPPPAEAFASLPAPASACASTLARHGIVENPPPYPRLCRRAPASSAAFTRRAVVGFLPRPRDRLDPALVSPEGVTIVLDPTLLVDLCNQNSPRAQPRTLRPPDGQVRNGAASDSALPSMQHPQLALGLEETSG